MEVETAENIAFWLVPPDSLSLSSTTQAHLPRDSASCSGLSLLTSKKPKKYFIDMAVGQSDLGNSPNEVPSPGD